MRCVAIIPARIESKRLPGKPLLEAGGKALVHWTYDRAMACEEISAVIVATPDKEIGRYCQEHGLIWRPTNADHPTGTHRCAEVIRQMGLKKNEVDVVVNWQVDEPLVPAKHVGTLISNVRGWSVGIGTLVSEPRETYSLDNENLTKVVVGQDGRALWFSRAPMRGSQPHIGIYAFKRALLLELELLPPTRLSEAESLEQLAWLEAGHTIDVDVVPDAYLSVNTEWDWKHFGRVTQKGKIV